MRTARSTSATSTPSPLTSLVVIKPVAPCALASSTKLCPSEFSPTKAKKSEPLTAERESNTGAEVITADALPYVLPPTIVAICSRVSAIIFCPQLHVQEPFDHQMDELLRQFLDLVRDLFLRRLQHHQAAQDSQLI